MQERLLIGSQPERSQPLMDQLCCPDEAELMAGFGRRH